MRQQGEMGERFAELQVSELLDEIGGDEQPTGGGTAAAIVLALAAALAANAARRSGPGWAEAGGAAAQAQTLRARALLLAEADALVYGEAVALMQGNGPTRDDRDWALKEALDRSADVPVLIAEAACDIALLAAEVAEGGNPKVGADAAVAAVLAEAVARSARHLVTVNLATVKDDERTERGERCAGIAGAAARRALRAD